MRLIVSYIYSQGAKRFFTFSPIIVDGVLCALPIVFVAAAIPFVYLLDSRYTAAMYDIKQLVGILKVNENSWTSGSLSLAVAAQGGKLASHLDSMLMLRHSV